MIVAFFATANAAPMDSKLETRRLRYFMQVLDSGSVRGAAGALGMDASAVSRAVGLLEWECGTALLERRGRGVAPMDAGRLLAAYLRQQQGEKQNLLARIDSIRKIESGHIDIMTGEGYVDWLMEKCLCPLMQAHARVTIGLDIGSTDEIEQCIIDERTHIGILFRPPKDERLRSYHSHPHLIRAWVLRSHPLAQLGRPLRLVDLTPYRRCIAASAFVSILKQPRSVRASASTSRSLPPHSMRSVIL
jgi:DNA-binding transcriptional LysR family regulator